MGSVPYTSACITVKSSVLIYFSTPQLGNFPSMISDDEVSDGKSMSETIWRAVKKALARGGPTEILGSPTEILGSPTEILGCPTETLKCQPKH